MVISTLVSGTLIALTFWYTSFPGCFSSDIVYLKYVSSVELYTLNTQCTILLLRFCFCMLLCVYFSVCLCVGKHAYLSACVCVGVHASAHT
jgi:hypothetical protein